MSISESTALEPDTLGVTVAIKEGDSSEVTAAAQAEPVLNQGQAGPRSPASKGEIIPEVGTSPGGDLIQARAGPDLESLSPERYNYGNCSSSSKRTEGSCRRRRQPSSSSDAQQGQWETGSPPTKRQRRSRGRPSGGARRRRRGGPVAPQQQQEPTRPASEGKVTCDIRLRVRAEYCEHGPALEQGVASRRPQALARQLDVFGQATAVLRSRDLGSVVCDIKFSELSYLDAFWGDYLSGALLQALRGVFLTEALREAVGREAVRLLVSVDEADYEAGRRRLLLMEEEGGRRPPEAS
ncbi:PREDICTED: DNA-binding death effector domain-containing protein 2 isoform X4 [Hipposideros armiger]|uniref:DNA-binding death effector domain-containing protein 2 isoform X4 n=1 Tax=Hipposideros armiger TaxID=186990 RepID=A0A8B7Q771_HIPAR|nr:PREDICTED: DNA-binding death effector domain-containing protein 2 isoform X4 [Hipposideros armiger]